MHDEEPSEDEAGTEPRLNLRGLLARITRNTEPKPRKRPQDDTGRREVRGD